MGLRQQEGDVESGVEDRTPIAGSAGTHFYSGSTNKMHSAFLPETDLGNHFPLI